MTHWPGWPATRSDPTSIGGWHSAEPSDSTSTFARVPATRDAVGSTWKTTGDSGIRDLALEEVVVELCPISDDTYELTLRPKTPCRPGGRSAAVRSSTWPAPPPTIGTGTALAHDTRHRTRGESRRAATAFAADVSVALRNTRSEEAINGLKLTGEAKVPPFSARGPLRPARPRRRMSARRDAMYRTIRRSALSEKHPVHHRSQRPPTTVR